MLPGPSVLLELEPRFLFESYYGRSCRCHFGPRRLVDAEPLQTWASSVRYRPIVDTQRFGAVNALDRRSSISLYRPQNHTRVHRWRLWEGAAPLR